MYFSQLRLCYLILGQSFDFVPSLGNFRRFFKTAYAFFACRNLTFIFSVDSKARKSLLDAFCIYRHQAIFSGFLKVPVKKRHFLRRVVID